MAWQSLYRRYRPKRFSEVVGQDHVVTALRNAVKEGRVAHAYLFSGPRGTGKTTSARLLAKALNCADPQDGEPCCSCESCLAIDAGTSYDLHELDAASNNGVDAMRDLIARAALGTPGRTKVYILDEVHMLSAGAANALLKTLEEPPDHVVFALATTDPHKVLPTIRSRTQHFELHLLPADLLEAHVRWVAADAGLDVDDEIIAHVLRVGGGSARDTLSALDQVVAAGGIDTRAGDTDALVTALLDRDPGAALTAVHAAVTAGRDPRVLAESLVGRLRDAFLASLGVELDHLPDVDRERTAELARRAERPFLTRSLEVLGTALVDMRQAADPRITLETALVRLADVRADTSVAALVERLDRLERALAAGGLPAPAAPAGGAGASPAAPAQGGAAPGPGGASPVRGPAEEARRLLAERAARAGQPDPGRPGPQAPPAASAPPPAPAAPPSTPEPPAPPPPAPPDGPTATAAGPATPNLGAAAPAAVAGSASVSPVASAGRAAAGDLPSREQLTVAWGDVIVGRLPGPARARYAGGRFVAVADGAAHFALPNEVHRKRCEELRGVVEAALAEHFGRPIPLRLVVDPGPGVPGGNGAPGAPVAGPGVDVEPEEHIDLDELVDAPAAPPRSAVERLTEVFPGAEVVEEEP